MDILTVLLAFILIFVAVIYVHSVRAYKFWESRNIPYAPPLIPWGNILEIVSTKIHFGYIMQKFYHQLKHHGDMVGLYFLTKPLFLVLSPEFAKQILVKDFNSFVDRGFYCNEKVDPLSGVLFALEGQKWKFVRDKIRPTFSSGKLKLMYHAIMACGTRLREFIDQSIAKNDSNVIEIRDLFARYTTDAIAGAVFSVESDSIFDPNSKFRRVTSKMFRFSKFRTMKMFVSFLFNREAKWLGLRIHDREVTKYFLELIRETVDYRREHNVERNDFLQLLMQLHYHGNLDDDTEKTVGKLSFEEIAAQCYMFLFAGFETSSNTMSIALYYLAQNMALQERARTEIRQIYENYESQITYDGINEMEYLERIILESQRIFPTAATLHRITTTDYTLPNGSKIPVGVRCIIPALAFHHDPEYYPNPDIFDPDRFTEEEKVKRHQYAYLAFGEGPRYCMGMRYGIVQTKIGLAVLLKDFKFSVCPKTEVPIEIDKVSMIHVPKNGLYLRVDKID